jgi:molybdopterin biosynthesis enzyme
LIKQESDDTRSYLDFHYPVSALMIFQVFVAPFLRNMASISWMEKTKGQILLSRRYIPSREDNNMY